jgi:hypothetical protein
MPPSERKSRSDRRLHLGSRKRIQAKKIKRIGEAGCAIQRSNGLGGIVTAVTHVRQLGVEDDWMNFQMRHDARGHPPPIPRGISC